MASQTIAQKIKESEDRTARLKTQARKLENGQKIITGGMQLSLARQDPKRAKTLLNDYQSYLTKDADIKRMQPIIDELTLIVNKYEQQNEQSELRHQDPKYQAR